MNEDKQAFPFEVNKTVFNKEYDVVHNETEFHPGLTKLEYFSGLIMQGYSAKKTCETFETQAKLAVDKAKALLKELEGSDD